MPSSKPFAADAPLVDQGAGLGLGLLGRQVVRAAVLGVDDHLGARARLDRVDGRLGADDRLGAEEARLVVDGAVGLGIREGRPGRNSGRPLTAAVGPRLGSLERALDDLGQRDEDRRVEVPGLERRHHLIVEDVLELGLTQRKTGSPVELDLTVLEAGVEVEQDHEAVVDAGPPDTPLVHQGCGVGLGLLGRDVVAAEGLGVDHDLGLGLRLDRVDDRLGLALRGRREDVGVVVDRLAVDGFGEGRTSSRWGGRCRNGRTGGKRDHPQDGGDEGEGAARSMHGAHREARITISPAG